MLLLLSGEGSSDIGATIHQDTQICATDQFTAGPLTLMIDQLAEQHPRLNYSLLDSHCVHFVAKQQLSMMAKEKPKRSMSLPGAKKPKETGYYFNNARLLGICAKELSTSLAQSVIVILFRDADGTASADRGLWQDKHQSMSDGFAAAGCAENGVPMLARPKSEAWLICACKPDAYQHCAQLEQRSGNDNSPNPLKAELMQLLGDTSAANLRHLVEMRRIDVSRIDMPSLNQFKQHFAAAIERA